MKSLQHPLNPEVQPWKVCSPVILFFKLHPNVSLKFQATHSPLFVHSCLQASMVWMFKKSGRPAIFTLPQDRKVSNFSFWQLDNLLDVVGNRNSLFLLKVCVCSTEVIGSRFATVCGVTECVFVGLRMFRVSIFLEFSAFTR